MIDNYNKIIAVVTGGGSGIGRELVRQLASAGADVAFCDLSPETVEQTAALVREESPNVRVLAVQADVSSEADLEAFRDAITTTFNTDQVHLVINNAGVGGGGSMFTTERADWERTFDIVWGGVYFGTRVFLPLLTAAPAAALVNTSSVNGFYASIGVDRPHTAYSAAKFAVKGFTEALITDLKVNAPHVSAHVVMPGHIGTRIVSNSMRAMVTEPTPEEAELMLAAAEMFENQAPTSAAEAAEIILDAVQAGRWRILVGDDAHRLDENVRANPEGAYDQPFFTLL
jgi:NAD(P)-dependent dehydrogenase (short-subunit alcohol dehydrogenase family)